MTTTNPTDQPVEACSSMHYAIRLPNGRLAHDIAGDVRIGRPEYRMLPDGRNTYLWSEYNAHQAHATLRYIADTMKHVGADEMFRQQARVVRVRITAEVSDEPVSDPDEDES
ncbi:hypothetical protein [Nocardia nova]|uniref:hypothetical protein n=1 Tax=Nocardia nova TaxID=37330 RepID=UPI0018962F7D|nr:hypothetical protein [Nocardia nova]MBF6277031.1 hypothetical protein [Nocardia nova]